MKRYPVELRERAVRMVGEIRSDHESEWAAMTQVALLLGVGTPETVRKWCRQTEVDTGRRSGTTSDESAVLKRLKRENCQRRPKTDPLLPGGFEAPGGQDSPGSDENAELKRANAILRSASAFFAAELDRPQR